MKQGSFLIVALFMGILLGMIFYGGLWWTVRRILSSKSPAVWLLGSFWLRAMIAVGGIYFVARGDLRSMVACVMGFLIARIGVTRWAGAPRDTKTSVIPETGP